MFNFNILAIVACDEHREFDTVMYRVYFGVDNIPHYCFAARDAKNLDLFGWFGASHPID
jgi:hypothetical protein